mmetsp:Transcript_118809/g.296265  ORF Transcript_118809/g.296265 Transcript_118809/m.296265 type:complete len:214 (+) Transcript_118809:325-966(+)
MPRSFCLLVGISAPSAAPKLRGKRPQLRERLPPPVLQRVWLVAPPPAQQPRCDPPRHPMSGNYRWLLRRQSSYPRGAKVLEIIMTLMPSHPATAAVASTICIRDPEPPAAPVPAVLRSPTARPGTWGRPSPKQPRTRRDCASRRHCRGSARRRNRSRAKRNRPRRRLLRRQKGLTSRFGITSTRYSVTISTTRSKPCLGNLSASKSVPRSGIP